MDDIRRAFDMCNHSRCAAARGEWISYRMRQRCIYRCRRQYRILPEAKYIEKSSTNDNLSVLPMSISSAYGIFAHKKQAADLENPALNRLFLQKRPQIYEIIPGDNPLPTAGRVCPPAPDRESITQFGAKVYYYFL